MCGLSGGMALKRRSSCDFVDASSPAGAGANPGSRTPRRSVGATCSVALSLALLIAACAPRIRPSPEHIPPSAHRLAQAIEAILARPELAPTHVGLAVWSLDRREWLYLREADKLFVPASNAKVLVAAAALYALGPSAVFTTTLAADTAQSDTLLPGNLYLVGGGNPDLSTGDLACLAERLRALGIRRVRGRLVLDASRFDSTAFGPGWMWDEGPYAYNAPVNAFMLNGNTVRLTIRPGKAIGDTVRAEVSPPGAGMSLVVSATTRSDTMSGPPLAVERPGAAFLVRGTMPQSSQPAVLVRTVPDPVAYAGSVFADALRSAGIAVDSGLTVGASPANGTILGVAASAPVDVLVRRFLKESDNLIGETLVKQLGVAAGAQGSWADGLSAVRRSLAAFAGLDSTSYRLADGSGLSRYTQVSPRMMVRVIAAAADEFAIAPEFLSALAVGGVDGTLAQRLADPGVAGYVRGKSGTMSGVSTLSGVVLASGGERLAFCLMMNGYVGPAANLRQAQDEVVAVLRAHLP